jgi:hypothetical protein
MDSTEIAFILDRSGSMHAIRDDAIGGFNAFVESQKAVPGEARFTFVSFDHEYETVMFRKNLREVEPLTPHTYVPRGTTALLDAIGRTVNAVGAQLAALPESERPSKVIVAILTDGMENASKEFTPSQIKEMVKHQEGIYSWEFIYLAANQDAFAVGGSLGIRKENIANFAPTGVGTRKAFETADKLTRSYRTRS